MFFFFHFQKTVYAENTLRLLHLNNNVVCLFFALCSLLHWCSYNTVCLCVLFGNYTKMLKGENNKMSNKYEQLLLWKG